jgi:uncharacterized protein (DUF1800 family)
VGRVTAAIAESQRLETQRLETAGRAGRQGGDGARAGRDIPSETSNGSRKGKTNCHAIVFPNGTDTVANAKPESATTRAHAFVCMDRQRCFTCSMTSLTIEGPAEPLGPSGTFSFRSQ